MMAFCSVVAQSCPTLCGPMDCCPPRSSVRGILQARILEWVAIPFSRGSSWPRDWTLVSCIAGRFLPSEPSGKPTFYLKCKSDVILLSFSFYHPHSRTQATYYYICAVAPPLPFQAHFSPGFPDCLTVLSQVQSLTRVLSWLFTTARAVPHFVQLSYQ